MTTEPKRTSFTRYRRVNDILQADRLLRTKLSKNMAAVCRPDQSHKEFPIEVVYVTDEIHKQGLDAFTLPKIEVVNTAHRLLVQNTGPIPVPAPPPPAPEKKKAAKPKAVKPKAAKPKPKPKPTPVKPKALPKAPATAEPSPAAVEPKTAGEPKGDGVAKLQCPEFVRPGIPFAVGIASMSNMEAAILLLESTSDERYRGAIQKLQEVIDEVRLHTVLPSAQKDVQPAG